MKPKPKKKPANPLTLKSLDKRITALESMMGTPFGGAIFNLSGDGMWKSTSTKTFKVDASETSGTCLGGKHQIPEGSSATESFPGQHVGCEFIGDRKKSGADIIDEELKKLEEELAEEEEELFFSGEHAPDNTPTPPKKPREPLTYFETLHAVVLGVIIVHLIIKLVSLF